MEQGAKPTYTVICSLYLLFLEHDQEKQTLTLFSTDIFSIHSPFIDHFELIHYNFIPQRLVLQ